MTHPDPTCPVCVHVLEEKGGLVSFGSTPEMGNFAVCSYCTAVLRYGEGLVLHEVTKPEFDKLDSKICNELTKVRVDIAIRDKR